MTGRLRRVLLVAVGLVVVAGLGVAVFASTLPEDDLAVLEPGELVLADDVAGEWRVGGLDVRLTEERLVVERDGRTVWESPEGPRGGAFLAAGAGAVDVEEHRGYFWPAVRHDETWPDQRVDEARLDDGTLRLSGTLRGSGDEVPWTLTVADAPDGARLRAEAPGADSLALTSGRSDGAAVHGLGEQFADFDLDGRLVPILVREQGVGRGDQPLSLLADLTNRSAAGHDLTTYAAAATWVTEDLRGVTLDPDDPSSHAFAVADLRTPDRVVLELWSDSLTAEVTAAASPSELVAARHEGSPTLPRWTQDGAIVGIQGGTDEVRERVARLRAAGVDVAGVWLQDWSGQRTTSFGERLWWTWQLDRDRYPAWRRLVSELREQGIAVTTYVNPFLVDASEKEDPPRRNLYAEAERAGHLVEHPDGSPYLLDQGGFDAALVDLTDPAARSWFSDVIAEEVLADGVSGFMADFGEGLPFDAEVHEGEAADVHNRWPRLWAEVVAQACRQAGRPDCLTWFRSGSLGMGEVAPLMWGGDQMVELGGEDGLESALLGTFSAGVSGWPLMHTDTGGYTSVDAVVEDHVRGPDLLARWSEAAAFGVVLRTHEGNRPDDNRQVHDEDEVEAFARATRIFAALEPYRRGVLAEARRLGLPAIRHGWLVAPGTDAAEVDTQFFLGRSVLVAPVLEEGADRVRVTFPPGRWLHLVTGEEHEGGREEVAAPLGRPAAFVRAEHPLARSLVRRVGDAVEPRWAE